MFLFKNNTRDDIAVMRRYEWRVQSLFLSRRTWKRWMFCGKTDVTFDRLSGSKTLNWSFWKEDGLHSFFSGASLRERLKVRACERTYCLYTTSSLCCSSVLFEFVSEGEQARSRVKRLFQRTHTEKKTVSRISHVISYYYSTHNFKREARRAY